LVVFAGEFSAEPAQRSIVTGGHPDLTRRRALGVGALGITTLALPGAASADSSLWTVTSTASSSFSGQNWTFYRAGGTSASTGPETIGDVSVLRLTDTQVMDTTGAVTNTAMFPAASGLDVRFTMVQWGSASGADGFCFFLVDAAANISFPGTAGGGLAYSGAGWNSFTFTQGQGILGGLVGVGFDNFGNFGAAAIGPKADGEAFTSFDGPGFQARPWLAIRGRRDTNYLLVSSVDRGTAGAGGTKEYWAGTTFAGSARRCRVTVTAGGQVTVYAGPKGDVSTAFTSLPQIDQVTIAGLFTGVTNVRIGFSAATGGQVNNHAVYEDVAVTSFSS
jgi:hypothetical protein